MKVLSVGDLHYNVRQFDWIVERAGAFDVIILTGDLLNIGCYVDLDTQILVVKKYLRRLAGKTTLLVCSGNHDGDRRDPSGEFFADWLDASSLDGIHGDRSSVRIGSWLFSVCPWWDGPVGRASVNSFLAGETAKEADNWFLVHHAPPSETRISQSRKGDFGDQDLRTFILEHQPKVVLCGHVHDAPFRSGGSWHDRIGETLVFNAGYQMASLPPYIVFNLEADEVSWESLAGHEEFLFDPVI